MHIFHFLKLYLSFYYNNYHHPTSLFFYFITYEYFSTCSFSCFHLDGFSVSVTPLSLGIITWSVTHKRTAEGNLGSLWIATKKNLHRQVSPNT